MVYVNYSLPFDITKIYCSAFILSLFNEAFYLCEASIKVELQQFNHMWKEQWRQWVAAFCENLGWMPGSNRLESGLENVVLLSRWCSWKVLQSVVNLNCYKKEEGWGRKLKKKKIYCFFLIVRSRKEQASISKFEERSQGRLVVLPISSLTRSYSKHDYLNHAMMGHAKRSPLPRSIFDSLWSWWRPSSPLVARQ